MKNILIITIPILLFTSLLYGQTKKTGVLYLWKNGTNYMGEWKDGKKHGQGTYYFSWGGELVGEFKEDKPWNVTEFDKDGNIIEMWVNGEMESIKI